MLELKIIGTIFGIGGAAAVGHSVVKDNMLVEDTSKSKVATASVSSQNSSNSD